MFSGRSDKNISFYNKPGGAQRPEIEPLLDQLAASFEPEKLKDLVARIQVMVFEDLPVVYLNWRNHLDAFLTSEKGFHTSKLKNHQDFRTVWFE